MNSELVILVDKIGPLNNSIRIEKDPIKKIELMWELGKFLNDFVEVNNYRLHTLLYELYDPHSTYKNTNLTRDLGSYCYRFYKYFENKTEIRQKINGIKGYALFREAFPLLSNPKYKFTDSQKDEIYNLIKQDNSAEKLKEIVNAKKKSIVKIKRQVKNKEFENEKKTLYEISNILNNSIRKTETSGEILKKINYDLIDLTNLVYCLMNMAYESSNKVETPTWKFESEELKPLFRLSFGTTENKARFRKWGLNTTELLELSEKLQCVINNDVQYLKTKYLNK